MMEVYRKVKTESDGLYQVGDRIAFTLGNGESVEALAVKQELDGMLFVTVDCLTEKFQMNARPRNTGGWRASNLRQVLNTEILSRFPESVREKMAPFPNGDFLRVPTEKEIFGNNRLAGRKEPDTVDQWESMKDRRNRIACFAGEKKDSEWCLYWLQNKNSSVISAFLCCTRYGDVDRYNANHSFGVRPVFKLRGEQSEA